MKQYLFSVLSLVTININAQIYTPSGQIQSNTNHTQNIGIGTDNPQSKLEIYGGGDLTLKGATADAGDLIFAQNTGLQNGRIWSNNDGGLFFSGRDTNPKLSINNNGNIGIGTNFPKYKLEVHGDSFSTSHTIESWSPTIYLKRDTNEGGYTQGIQTSLLNGDNNWFFGNLHADQWIVAKGDYTGSLFRISSSGNASLQGKLEAKEVKVTTTPTADFVFADNYSLPTLEEVEQHIKEKRHLPEIASAKEMEKEGVNIGEFQIKLLQKIEELTLYSIEQNKKIKELEAKIMSLQK